MGNKETKAVEETEIRPRKNEKHSELETIFDHLASGQSTISQETFTRIFDDLLGPLIFQYFSDGGDLQVDKNSFVSRASPFFGTSSDFYYALLVGNGEKLNEKSVSTVIDACRRAAKCVDLNSERDHKFLLSIANSAVSDGVGSEISLQEFKSWVESNCPRLLSNLQKNVISILKTGHPQGSDGPLVASQLLSPFQICFETKVFNYRSPTIMFIKLTDATTYVVGVDVEWRQGSQNFGGSDCVAYELSPKFRLLDSGSGLILFNTKLRTSTMGLVIGKVHQPPCLKVNPDFSNISDIEVWGCGTADTAAAQMEHKNWQKKQAERHAKVPLPGKWDENPDKSLLEMAGIKVDHSER